MFAPIYICPEHGETWHAKIEEIIDTERDSVDEVRVCPKCFREVTPLLHEGQQVLHALTDEEMYWETMSYE